jgi:SNF2 family DNA or RNA helicase
MKLRPYQKEGMRFLVREKKAALYWEMRLGKSITSLKAIKVLRAFPCLIIAPYSAFPAWREAADNNINEVVGEFEERIARLRVIENFNIVNKEAHLMIGRTFNKINWGSIILDESTCIKNPTTEISKFFTKYFKKVPVKFILAGIPAPESDFNYLQQMIFLDALGMNFYEFRFRFCKAIMEKQGFWVFRRAGKELLTSILAAKTSFLKLKDVKLGVDKIYEKREIVLEKSERKFYNQLMDELKISNDKMTIYEMTAWVWARKYFGGVLPENKFNGKIDELKYLYENDLKTEKTIIFACFIDEIEIISKSIKGAEKIYGKINPIKRNKIINDFQNGKIKHLICQPEVVRHGLNLSAASINIFYSTPLGLETRYQCEARSLLGDKNVLIIDLYVKNTIEEDIIESLRRKENRRQMTERIIRRIQSARK